MTDRMTDIIEVFGHGGDVETAASRFGEIPPIFSILAQTSIPWVRRRKCCVHWNRV